MFIPSTDKIKEIYSQEPRHIDTLKKVLHSSTYIYIDYANVFYWQNKLGFHIDYKRLFQLFKSFDTIHSTKVYQGILIGDITSQKTIEDLQSYGYNLRTKPVKIMKLSIDVTSIPDDSTEVLKNFILPALLPRLSQSTIRYLNQMLLQLNKKGILQIEHRKCNFDVEIASDMLIDAKTFSEIKTFILWSGDSDFADTVTQLIKSGKKVVIFATARRITKELLNTGAQFFDIQKLKSYICWKREL